MFEYANEPLDISLEIKLHRHFVLISVKLHAELKDHTQFQLVRAGIDFISPVGDHIYSVI